MMNTMMTNDPASTDAVHAPVVDPADPYATAEAKVDHARAIVRRREEEFEAAGQILPNLRARLRAGDEGVTTQDLATGAMAEERAELLLKAAEAALKKEKGRGPFRPDVARLLVDVVRAGLGADAVAVVDDAADGREVLHATIRQAAPTKPTPWAAGAVQCDSLEVVFWRTDRHRSADWERLERAFERAGHLVDVNSRAWVELDGLVGDRAELFARRVFPSELCVPPLGEQANFWDLRVVVGAAVAVMDEELPTHVTLTTSGQTHRQTVRNGRISTDIEVTFTAKAGRDRSTGQARPMGGVLPILSGAPSALVGRPFAGVGHLRSVETVPTKAKDTMDQVTQRLRFVLDAKAERGAA